MAKDRTASDRITELRKFRGESQAEFAKNLDVTQPMVSGWEGGSVEPSSGAYLRLGNLARYPDNLWFWSQAGVEAAAMESAVGQLLRDRGSAPAAGESIRLSCYRLTGQGTDRLEREITFPAEFSRDPASTVCLIIDEISASPWLPTGDLVVLDISHRESPDLRCFWNQIVLVSVDPGLPSGYGALHMAGSWKPGNVIMGLLRHKRIHQKGSYGLGWVATIGPLGDAEEQHRQAEIYHPIGHWNPAETAPSETFLEYRNWLGKETHDRRREDKLERLERKLHDQALEEIRLEPAYCIIGRVIAWIRPT
jgi:transcriptional regulator with XRE-family HTH domain